MHGTAIRTLRGPVMRSRGLKLFPELQLAICRHSTTTKICMRTLTSWTICRLRMQTQTRPRIRNGEDFLSSSGRRLANYNKTSGRSGEEQVHFEHDGSRIDADADPAVVCSTP